MRYRFLEFVVDRDQQELFGPVGPLPLRRQTFRVLLHLIERAPAVVSKDELLDAIWGHHALSQTAVAQTIRELRDTLADDVQRPRVIATKHRVGYQFIAPLSEEAPPAAASVEPPQPSVPASMPFQRPARIRYRRALPLVAAVLATAIAAIVAAWFWYRVPPIPESASAWPRDEHALRLAHEGLLAARMLRIGTALLLLQQARAIEDRPRLALLQARLHLALGDPSAVNGILQALDYMQPAPTRIDRRLAQAIAHEAAGRPADAMAEYRIVHQIDPDDLDLGLALFEIEIDERRTSARATYDQLSGHPQLPPLRRMLMSAQTAMVLRDGEAATQHAKAVLAATGPDLSPELSAMARIELARAAHAAGRLDEMRAELVAAGMILDSSGLLRAAADAGLQRVEPAIAQGDLEAASQTIEALTRRLDAIGDRYTLGRLLHARGRIALRSGRDDEAVTLFAAAAEQHEQAGNSDGVVSALGAQSGPLRRLGRADDAAKVLAQALSLAERAASANVRATLHGNLGNHYAEDGRLDEAQRQFEMALGLYRRIGDRRWEAIALGSLAEIATSRGDLRAARGHHDQALAVFIEIQAPLDTARVQHNLAKLALRDGDLSEATAHAAAAREILLRLQHRPRLARVALIDAEVRLLMADLAGAGQALAEAQQLADGDVGVLADAAWLQGRIAALQGHEDEAVDLLRSALSGYERAGQRAPAQAVRLELARAGLMRGRVVAAEQEATVLAAMAETESRPVDAVDARLLRLESLLMQARMDEAEREAGALRAQIERAPSFRALAEWTRLRARLDLDRNDRRERLDWLLAQARSHGQHLLVLRTQAERLAELSPAEQAEWHAEVERRGLAGLNAAQLRIGR